MFRRGPDDLNVGFGQRGVVECRLEIADREGRESDAIRKDGVGRGRREIQMVSR